MHIVLEKWMLLIYIIVESNFSILFEKPDTIDKCAYYVQNRTHNDSSSHRKMQWMDEWINLTEHNIRMELDWWLDGIIYDENFKKQMSFYFRHWNFKRINKK